MYASAKTNPPQQQSFPKGLKTVGILMILFGLVEIMLCLTQNFSGFISAPVTTPTILSFVISIFSSIAGLLILTKKRNSAFLAIILLALGVIGRIIMVVAGFYPMQSEVQSFAVILETSVAVLFGVHLIQNIQSFE
jgi:surface polysaccharide O-acyltransferase-like enzyme